MLNMTQAVALPASGDIEYPYEIVPMNFKEDRWVQMAEVLPTLRSNVHHAVVYVRPPDSNWLRHAPIGVPFTPATLTDPEDRRGAHLDGQRRPARLCAGEFSGGVTRKNGEISSCGLRPCFSNTVHRQWPRRRRSIKHRTDFFETCARAARADAATHKRPFRDPAGRAGLPGRGARHASQRRHAVQLFFRTCTCEESASNTT